MLKSFWFWTIIIGVAIQFVSLNVSAKLPTTPSQEIQAPKEIMSILKRSCYDCHSSEVKEPWYYNLAPISWVVQSHVKKGREVVNFSEWNSYEKSKQLKVLDRLPKAIIIRMPMPSYLWLHSEAELSSKEKKELIKWAKEMKF